MKLNKKCTITTILLFIITIITSNNLPAYQYNRHDVIPVMVAKVWPKGNPSESYDYYSLPFCDPKKAVSQSFGFDISGGRKYIMPYEIKFKGCVTTTSIYCIDDLISTPVCTKELNVADVKKLKKAIEEQYTFLMYFDDLPIKGSIGKIERGRGNEKRYYITTHLDFRVSFNGRSVIEVSLGDRHRFVDITDEKPTKIDFTYSVKWEPTTKEFSQRLEKYVEMRMFPEEIEIQWFSIVNSLVLVVLLTSFLAFILMRILKKDFQNYTSEDDDKEETGWKLIHGDVFRLPRNENLLAALLGNGAQLLSLLFCILVLALLGAFYPDYTYRTMYTALVIVYALTTGISGFVSGAFYKQLGGTRWVSNVLLTNFLFVGPLFVVWSILNTIAISYGSSAAFPFKSIVIILALYFLVSFPLTLIGAITAKNFVGPFQAPCRTKKVPREIPPVAWYKGSFAQFLVAGFLPFSAIYVELYYIFVSLWGTIMYTPFPILFLVFIILILVTSCITIAMTYLQISQENHKWWWRAVFCGGSTSLFIFGYSIFFYYFESQMTGFMQFAFYFGYTLMACYAFFLMLSTVGFVSSLVFMKKIYAALRVD